MMKYLFLALAVTAISAESLSDSDAPEFSIDEFLDADMSLPCTPKTCVPICRPVTKYLSFGAFKLPYTENVCAPDHKCLAAAAACIKTLQAAMADAHKKGLALETASKAKNAAHASKASKDKAAAARKAEAAAAATALGLAKAAFEAAEKEAANAKAAKESASKQYTAKAAAMDARLKSYEKAQQAHKNAVAAYDGAKSAAAAAAKAYAAAVKAHCDAEAQHAAAVKNIGHGHLAQKNCAAQPAGKVCDGNNKAPGVGGYTLIAGCTKSAHCTHYYAQKANTPDAAVCAKICDQDSSCKAFSWNTANTRSGNRYCMKCRSTSSRSDPGENWVVYKKGN